MTEMRASIYFHPICTPGEKVGSLTHPGTAGTPAGAVWGAAKPVSSLGCVCSSLASGRVWYIDIIN